MIKLLSSFLLSFIGLASTAQFNAEKDPYLVKDLRGTNLQKINAQTSHGNIAVSVVAAAEARIEVYARPGNSDERNLDKQEIKQRLDENYTLDITVSDGQLTAVAKRKTSLDIGSKSISISFVIYTVQNVGTILRTSHGNISISGLTGSQDVATSHGNLSIETINGKLTGETSHGDISVSGSHDDIDLRTSHGNINTKECAGTIRLVTSQGSVQLTSLKGKISTHTDHGDVAGDLIEGELSAATSHGNIDFKNLSCTLEAATSHGNISAFFNQLTGRVALDNSDGNITLQLPKGKGIDINLQGREIKLEPMENFSGSKETHSMKGSLNGGGIPVKAITSKGTVSLVFR